MKASKLFLLKHNIRWTWFRLTGQLTTTWTHEFCRLQFKTEKELVNHICELKKQ